MIRSLIGGPEDGRLIEIADGVRELRIPIAPPIPPPPESPDEVPAFSAEMPQYFRELTYRRDEGGQFVFASER